MISSLARAFLITALCLSIGLHWVVLQSVAWTSMLVGFSKQTSLSEAVAKTFDGEHPCSLCHMVAKGKRSEKKHDLKPTTPKLDLGLSRAAPGLFLPAHELAYHCADVPVITRDYAPPNPPPQSSARI